MEYEIVELEEKIVEGICVKTSNENGKSVSDIGLVWNQFFVEGIYNKIRKQDK